MAKDLPDSCKRGDHDFDQADTHPDERRTGGAGARTQPTTDREYKEQMRKLQRGDN